MRGCCCSVGTGVVGFCLRGERLGLAQNTKSRDFTAKDRVGGRVEL